ncbi:MAG: hypothetical protein KatS3mg014_0337 [Actinomycetota bacterium]|nr:MAG: hypothetical protein KatS3mg014_0337 [Actinomycetota bacterium]
MVAVFLGWLILGERVGLRTVLAGGVVLASVAAIISAGGAHRVVEPVQEPDLERC